MSKGGQYLPSNIKYRYLHQRRCDRMVRICYNAWSTWTSFCWPMW